jgi:hypothetical protein
MPPRLPRTRRALSPTRPRRDWYKTLNAPGFTLRRPATIGMEAYTAHRSGVPLAGGEAQGFISGAGTLTLQVGPQGAGTVWYPASVTTFTTSGVLDASTCLIYMGAAGTPVNLMGTLFPGGAGVLAVALPPLTVGTFVIAVFTGGKPGDVAAINITGTMDYLDTESGP